MRNLFVALSALMIVGNSYSQNVGIGTNTPDASAKLDVTSTNSGMLVPRVSLISTVDVATIATPATSLLVYNTNAGIVGGSGVGFYHWDGASWTKLLTGGGASTDWSLTGNSGTNAGTNFVGTTDGIDFVTRTNNVERMRVTTAGSVGIGIAGPTQRLDVQGGNARINNAFIGDVGHGAGWGGISNSSSATTTGYALIQNTSGDYTLINKQNTGSGWIGFRVANADVAVITNAGNFGVGTTSPAYKIQSNGDIYANGGWMRVSGNQGLYFQSYGGGWHMTDGTWIRAYNNKPVYVQNLLRADQGLYATDQVRLRNSNSNQFGSINAFGLNGVTLEQGVSESSGFHSDGDQADIWSPGDGGRLLRVWDEDGMVERWYLDGVGNAFTVSDRTKKKNIVELENGLDKITALQGYSYNYKLNGNEAEKVASGEHIEVRSIGVMAQEVEVVIPEAVNTDENGNKHISYDMLVPVLIEAIKEQQTQIEELKARVNQLENN